VAAVKISVLLVDDNAAVLRALSRTLRDDELEVYTAADADDALEVLRKHLIDIILTDIDMPGMSGFELLAIVRREFPDMIRMMLTGDATTERAVAAINEGEVARFFPKPVDGAALRATLLSFRDRVHRVRRDIERRREQARVKALTAWAENNFPGVTELARDKSGAIIVDRAAYDLVFTRR